jgi:hypothetical protein
MNDIEKSSVEKKPGRWALEALPAAIFISAAIGFTANGYINIAGHTGQAILHLAVGFLCAWVACFYLIGRLKGGFR